MWDNCDNTAIILLQTPVSARALQINTYVKKKKRKKVSFYCFISISFIFLSTENSTLAQKNIMKWSMNEVKLAATAPLQVKIPPWGEEWEAAGEFSLT